MVVLGERSQIPMYGSGLSTPLAWCRPRPYTAELQTCLETAAEAAPSILLWVLVVLRVSFHLRPPDLLPSHPGKAPRDVWPHTAAAVGSVHCFGRCAAIWKAAIAPQGLGFQLCFPPLVLSLRQAMNFVQHGCFPAIPSY